MNDQIIQTWLINQRVNQMLLDSLTVEGLASTMSPRGRNVAHQWAHLHNTRIMWLEVASPKLAEGLEKIKKEDSPNKGFLKSALKDSSMAMEALLKESLEKGKVKNFKGGLVPFLGYMLAHEGHHRGQIMLTLKLAGHPVSKEVSFGTWDWGKI